MFNSPGTPSTSMHTTHQKYFPRHPPDGPHPNLMHPIYRITPPPGPPPHTLISIIIIPPTYTFTLIYMSIGSSDA